MTVKMGSKRMKNIEMGILVLYRSLSLLLILTPNVLLPCQGEQRWFFSLIVVKPVCCPVLTPPAAEPAARGCT